MAVNLTEVLRGLCLSAKDFYLPGTVAELDGVPSPLEFLKHYVMPNIPVVIRGGVGHWPALSKWTDEYLCQCLGKDLILNSLFSSSLSYQFSYFR